MSIAQNLMSVRAALDAACRDAGREPAEVRLLPVSKYHPVEALREAHRAGYRLFGENKPQELAAKYAELADEGIQFAAIGHVQTNKAKIVAEAAAELHSLDSQRLAEALQRRLERLGRRLPVLVQVNTSGEAAKSGVSPEEAFDFARMVTRYDALEVRGLMTMAINSSDESRVAACFATLSELRDRLRQADGGGWDELNMGMSGDYRIAVAHGATCVRIGTAIFGVRESPPSH